MQENRVTSENKVEVLASSRRQSWVTVEEGICTPRAGIFTSDSILSIASTLLDQPPWLEARYLYDSRGSSLFEEICNLPEYYLTRTENQILASHAAEVLESAPVDCLLELGAGYSVKTRHLLQQQVLQRGGGTYAPVEVSLDALKASQEGVTEEYPELEFHGLNARYEQALADVNRENSTLFIFLGSTLGNMMRMELTTFLNCLSSAMSPGAFLLLGVDRVKDPQILQRAYDDSAGITRQFICNVLLNINNLTGSGFRTEDFVYEPVYNPHWQQMELYLTAERSFSLEFPTLGISREWHKGEKLLVEVSRKFEPSRLAVQLRSYGLELTRQWSDPRSWFSLLLFRKSAR